MGVSTGTTTVDSKPLLDFGSRLAVIVGDYRPPLDNS